MPRHQLEIVNRVAHATFVHSEKFYLLAMLVCFGVGVLIASSGLLASRFATPPVFIGLALAILTVVGSFTKVYSAMGKNMWECSCSQLEEIEALQVFDFFRYLLLITVVGALAYCLPHLLQKFLDREFAISLSVASFFIGAGLVFFSAYRADLIDKLVAKLPSEEEFLRAHFEDTDEVPEYIKLHAKLNEELSEEKRFKRKPAEQKPEQKEPPAN